jgi:carbamoyltransferase
MNILGISAYYHDSAAALLSNGQLIAAAQEERFSRKKHDPGFPQNAILYCLSTSGVKLADIDYICFYDKPLIKFERLLETYLFSAPKGVRSFTKAMPVWLKEKLFLKVILKKELAKLGEIPEKELPPLLFNEHHRSHAASAFFPSPFEKAAVLCLDGVGEWATTSVWKGDNNSLTPLWEIDFPHSLGLLYSAFTYFTGFKVNSGEYKLMGLAPYGEPRFVTQILDNLLDLKKDGTFRLDMRYFNYLSGLTMTNKRFNKLFEGPPRNPESQITQREMDLARSIQVVTEKIILRLANTVNQELGEPNLCLAGGVALNCVANGRILEEGPFDKLWIQPASGDAGGAVGAAFSVWHEYLNNKRTVTSDDSMQGAYLGPKLPAEDIQKYLDSVGAVYHRMEEEELLEYVAELLAEGNIVGWFQGRMEFGPRALGNRSILGDPRNPKMQSTMNLKIKHRESFRPFAPAVILDKATEWFNLKHKSPYMLLVTSIREEKRKAVSEGSEKLFGIDKLKITRSEIPAVTHVDWSARVQTVSKDTNPKFYQLINKFEQRTDCPVLINTSFNVRGEPIVCSPEDALRCFMHTEIDYLALENFLLHKKEQPKALSTLWEDPKFELD